jgi:hypothetical protein
MEDHAPTRSRLFLKDHTLASSYSLALDDIHQSTIAMLSTGALLWISCRPLLKM